MRAWIAMVALAALSQAAQADQTARFRIMSDDRFETRRVVAVELAERAPLAELSRIANSLKARARKPYQRTIVNFYLPSMSLGDGSWATVAYTPERNTTINGLSFEEVKAFTNQALDDKRDRVGTWLANSSAIAGAVTIFRDQRKVFVEWTLKSGLRSIDEVIASRTWRGLRYDIKSGSRTHFLATTDNDLEVRDDKALIATAEPILLNDTQRRLREMARAREKQGRDAQMHTITQHVTPTLSASDYDVPARRRATDMAAEREISGSNPAYQELENQPIETIRNKPRRAASQMIKRTVRKKAHRTTNDVLLENLFR